MVIRKITIEFTDDPNDIRNQDLADYEQDKDGNKTFKIYQRNKSDLWKYWADLCMFHELTEYESLDIKGIKEEEVTAFDKWFLENNLCGQPGDHPLSVYRAEHRNGENIERILCAFWGLNWHDYFDKYAIPDNFKYNENYGKD